MLRVALFTDTFAPDVNGAALTLARWTDYLREHEVPCIVFAPEGDRAQPVGSEVERFRSIPFFLYKECQLAIPNAKQINNRLRAFSPTLIHVATPFNLGLFGASYAAKHHIPLVASYHTHFDKYLDYYRLRWLEPALWKYMLWFHRNCERIYVPSRSTLAELKNKDFNNLEIWGRGIDSTLFSPTGQREQVWAKWNIRPRKYIILYVGRLAPEKGIEILMESFKRLPERLRSQSVLVVAGDGPLSRVMDPVAHGLPADTVEWLGFVTGIDLAEWYAAADLFLFPSATETFGNVVLEAMASGTAVIGAGEGGVKDLICHGHNGWLCPANDAQAFAEAATQLLDNSVLRGQLASAGRESSRSHSWDSIFSRLLASYQDAASPKMLPAARM
ncbi:glycosyltransferase family 1 protein [Paenibacillus sp. P96]|uniref:Glycosyltransferase family 1 protein n=1 Tax=Paenibacillus zeirhizosphaerae TaxID=2987519 RepID=A0ABT9FSZ4_9BACL|nr:glycosyltransferase family 1 protein [Paenibacillus sp. P96]MDP4097616.1 glycosyltransferase family 1 protein [Paenibacillus sp. P96]